MRQTKPPPPEAVVIEIMQSIAGVPPGPNGSLLGGGGGKGARKTEGIPMRENNQCHSQNSIQKSLILYIYSMK